MKGAPGARPFPPRSYDLRYGRAAVIALLRKLGDRGVTLTDKTYTVHSPDEWADQLETEEAP